MDLRIDDLASVGLGGGLARALRQQCARQVPVASVPATKLRRVGMDRSP
jgi:hypothetical protein